MWDINDVNPPEAEAVQAEREVWEDIARTAQLDAARAEYRAMQEHPYATACGEADAVADEIEQLEREITPVDTTVSFKRLRNGAWGITGPAGLLVTGQLVAVTKRSGETTTVTVGRVLWSGDGKAIAATRRA